MNLLKSLSAVALATVAVAAAHPAAAQTSTIALQNGSFAGTGSSPYVGTRNGTIGFTGVTSVQDTGYYQYGSHTQNGVNGLYVNGGSVYQFLGTTGAAGETLALSGNFYGDAGLNRAGVEFASVAPTASNDTAAGSVLASENLQPLATSTDTAFAPLTFTTTTASQDVYLVIEGADTTTAGEYSAQVNYDTFSLKDIPAAPAAVPEASSSISLGLLLMLALGGFAVARKRSSQAA